jgi:hypothetical protein
MNGKYLMMLCEKKINSRPKSITVKYRPFVESYINKIIEDFKNLSQGTIYENVAIKLIPRRSGGICNSCGYGRNFLHTWEPCPNCGSPADFVDYVSEKQIELGEVLY